MSRDTVVVAICVTAVIVAAGFTAGYRNKQMESIDYIIERNKRLEARVTALREEAERCRMRRMR